MLGRSQRCCLRGGDCLVFVENTPFVRYEEGDVVCMGNGGVWNVLCCCCDCGRLW